MSEQELWDAAMRFFGFTLPLRRDQLFLVQYAVDRAKEYYSR